MTVKSTILSLAAAVALASNAGVKQIASGQRLVFMGDSITDYGWSRCHGYPNLVLKGLAANGISLEKNVTSFGVGVAGEKSGDMLKRFDDAVVAKDPDVVTISAGVNDILFNTTYDAFYQNMLSMVAKAKGAGAKVILLSPTAVGYSEVTTDTLSQFVGGVREIAAAQGCAYAPVYEMFRDYIDDPDSPAIDSVGRRATCDSCHMAAAGDRQLARAALKGFGLDVSELAKAETAWNSAAVVPFVPYDGADGSISVSLTTSEANAISGISLLEAVARGAASLAANPSLESAASGATAVKTFNKSTGYITYKTYDQLLIAARKLGISFDEAVKCAVLRAARTRGAATAASAPVAVVNDVLADKDCAWFDVTIASVGGNASACEVSVKCGTSAGSLGSSRLIAVGENGSFVSEPVTGLAANTTYYYELTFKNNASQTKVLTGSFKTPAATGLVSPGGVDDTAAIQSAINAAGANGTVTLSGGVFYLNGSLKLQNGVTLKGQGMTKTILHERGAQRVAELSGNAKIMDLTVENGKGMNVAGYSASWPIGGGFLVRGGTVSGCRVWHNNIANGNGYGAGIFISKGTVKDSVIAFNTLKSASSHGAGIGNWGVSDLGAITVDHCLIYGNETKGGKGGGIGLAYNNNAIAISDTTIAGNVASGAGGGLSTGGSGKVTLTGSVISGNAAGSGSADIDGTLASDSANNILGTASFVDAASRDYRLVTGSASVGYFGSETGDSTHTHTWSAISYKWSVNNATCTASRTCSGCQRQETATVNSTSSDSGTTRTFTAVFASPFTTQTKSVTITDPGTAGETTGTGVQLWANGPYWATKNVGATSESGIGKLFSWGATTGFEKNATTAFDGGCPTMEMSVSALKSAGYIDTNGNLVKDCDAANAVMGGDWRMPTKSELDALKANCVYEATTVDGVKCLKVTGKDDFATASIILPVVGYYSNGGKYDTEGINGFYSSATVYDEVENKRLYGINIQATWMGVAKNLIRNNGYAIRAVSSTKPTGGEGEGEGEVEGGEDNPGDGKLTIDSTVSDHCVLLQNADNIVKGTTAAGRTVTVTFGGKTAFAKADASGNYKATFNPGAANATGRTLTVSDGSATLSVSDVLVGEVWFVAGQSNAFNMMDPVVMSGDYATAYPEWKKEFECPNVRVVISTPTQSAGGVSDYYKAAPTQPLNWIVCRTSNEDNVKKISPLAFFFGKKLSKQKSCPVGIVLVGKGGSPIGYHLTAEGSALAKQYFGGDYDYGDGVNLGLNFSACYTRTDTIAARGVIWAQGETGGGRKYRHLLRALVENWRSRRNQNDLPFLIYSFANYDSGSEAEGDGKWPRVRWEQEKAVAELIPNAAVFHAIDLSGSSQKGYARSIHPDQKPELAERALLAARNLAYGENVAYRCPYPTQAYFGSDKGKIHVTFPSSVALTMTGSYTHIPFRVKNLGMDLYGDCVNPTSVKIGTDGHSLEIAFDTSKLAVNTSDNGNCIEYCNVALTADETWIYEQRIKDQNGFPMPPFSLAIANAASAHTHTWGNMSYSWSADNMTCTASRTCSGCYVSESSSVTATYSDSGTTRTFTAVFASPFETQTKSVTITDPGTGGGDTPSDDPIPAFVSADYYVSTKGSDSNNGTSRSTAFATIKKAVSTAVAGQKICVLKGTYKVQDSSLWSSNGGIVLDKAVTLFGETGNPADVVIHNDREWTDSDQCWQKIFRTVKLNDAGAVLSGVTVENGIIRYGDRDEDQKHFGANVLIAENGGTVTNCIIRNGRADTWGNAVGDRDPGTAGGVGGIACFSQQGLITHCVITNNSSSMGRTSTNGSKALSGGGIVHMKAGTLRQSLIAYNTITEVWCGSAVYAGESSDAETLVENCTIYGNKYVQGPKIGNYDDAGQLYPVWIPYPYVDDGTKMPEIRNCLIYGNVTHNGGKNLIDWSCYNNGKTPAACFVNCATDMTPPMGATMITTGITLMDDFRPAAGSSIIDAGAAMKSPVALDLGRITRVKGSAVDIGCYEYPDGETPQEDDPVVPGGDDDDDDDDPDPGTAGGHTGTLDGHEGVQLWKDGPYWATVNGGATKVGEPGSFYYNSTDTYGYAPASGYFGKLGRNSSETLWGNGWHKPSEAEFQALINNTTFLGVEVIDEVNCAKLCGKSEEYKDAIIYFPIIGWGNGGTISSSGNCWNTQVKYWGSTASGQYMRNLQLIPGNYATNPNKWMEIVSNGASHGNYYPVRQVADASAVTPSGPTHTHVWGTPSYTWTEVSGGYTCKGTVTCTEDSSHKKTATATVTYAVDTAPTTAAVGKGIYTATFSDSVFTTQTKEVEIPKLHEHTYGTPTYTWSADYKTCTASAKCTASGCSDTISETVNASENVTKEPTTEETGTCIYTATFKNAKFTQQSETVTIPKLPSGPDANGYEYVQLWKDGPLWAKMNVGATSATDVGLFFSWGSTVGTAKGATVAYNGNCVTMNKSVSALSSYLDADNNLKVEYDAASANMGGDWRMPTAAEMSALIENCDVSSDITLVGTWVQGRGDYSAVKIFLPNGGFYQDGGKIVNIGTYGFYLSSTPNNNETQAKAFRLMEASPLKVDVCNRNNGYPIRGVLPYIPGSNPGADTHVHTWGTPTYSWSADGKSCTATRSCTGCTEKETETVTATFVTTKEATTEATGLGHYEASFKNTAFAKQSGADVTIPKKEQQDDPGTGGGDDPIDAEGDYYVSMTGSDSNKGTSPDSAFATIAHAVEVAAAGQKITVLAGIYELKDAITIDKAITVAGEGWEKTVFKQTTWGKRCVLLDNGAKLVGVTLTGGNAYGNYETGSGCGAQINNGTISWCCISNNYVASGNNAHGTGVLINQGTIDHSIITDNRGGNYSVGGGIGAYDISGPVVIDTCLIYGNTAKDNGGGIGFAAYNGDVTVRNCTITGNSTEKGNGGLWVNSDSKNTKTLVMNTIISGNVVAGDENNTSSPFNADSAGNLLGGDPKFVDAANGNYRLSAGSPAIGAGVVYAGIGNDLDNNPFAATPSVGCYEFDTVPRPDPIEFGEVAVRPLTDYNGSAVTVAFTGDVPDGAELSAKITVGGVDYAGTVGDGVITFAIPASAVTAGNTYDATVMLKVGGDDYRKSVTLTQGTPKVDEDADWIDESAASYNSTGTWSGDKTAVENGKIVVSNATFTAAKPSSADGRVTVATTMVFNGPAEVALDPAARAGVQVVKVGGVNRYAFLTAGGVVTNTSATASVGTSVAVKVDLDYAKGEVSYTVGGTSFGPFAATAGAKSVSSARYIGAATVTSLTGSYRYEGLDSNLAQVGDEEYATVADAFAAADGETVTLLWDASWAPSAVGDYLVVTNGHLLAIGGSLAYSVLPNQDGTITVSVTGGEEPSPAEPASITFSGSTVRIAVANVRADLWYAIEKTTDLTQPFVVEESTWTSGADLLAGSSELAIAFDAGETSAFYRLVTSKTAQK